jgi:hypothetical protein
LKTYFYTYNGSTIIESTSATSSNVYYWVSSFAIWRFNLNSHNKLLHGSPYFNYGRRWGDALEGIEKSLQKPMVATLP